MTDRITERLRRAGAAQTPSVLLFVETSREFGRGLLHGIARYSRLHGPWRVYRWPGALDSSLPEWKSLKIDGAIVRDVKVVEGLAHSGIPVIFAQHNKESYAPFPSIITDSALDRGHGGRAFSRSRLSEFRLLRTRRVRLVPRAGAVRSASGCSRRASRSTCIGSRSRRRAGRSATSRTTLPSGCSRCPSRWR